MEYPITQPIRAFARDQRISPTRLYDLADDGEIETVLIGNRRHIIVASYGRYVERQVAAQAGKKLPTSNPKAKARQAGATAPPVPRAKGSHRAEQ